LPLPNPLRYRRIWTTMLVINSQLEIPEDEIVLEASPSSGPGGQNVNRVHTRVSLLFDVAASSVLTEGQRARITERLASRISKERILRVVSERHRTQGQNREDVRERFQTLLAAALTDEPPRVPTRVPRREKHRRLENKRHRSEVKRGRGDSRDEPA
jgi:ribosome-associated protein